MAGIVLQFIVQCLFFLLDPIGRHFFLSFLYANVRDVAKKQFYFVRNLRMLRVVNRKLIFVQKNFHL